MSCPKHYSILFSFAMYASFYQFNTSFICPVASSFSFGFLVLGFRFFGFGSTAVQNRQDIQDVRQ